MLKELIINVRNSNWNSRTIYLANYRVYGHDLGDTTGVAYNTLERDSDLESFSDIVLEATNSLMENEGVIVFVDMFATNPYYAVIARYYLPILIESMMNREFMRVPEFVTHLKSVASDRIVIGELLQC